MVIILAEKLKAACRLFVFSCIGNLLGQVDACGRSITRRLFEKSTSYSVRISGELEWRYGGGLK